MRYSPRLIFLAFLLLCGCASLTTTALKPTDTIRNATTADMSAATRFQTRRQPSTGNPNLEIAVERQITREESFQRRHIEKRTLKPGARAVLWLGGPEGDGGHSPGRGSPAATGVTLPPEQPAPSRRDPIGKGTPVELADVAGWQLASQRPLSVVIRYPVSRVRGIPNLNMNLFGRVESYDPDLGTAEDGEPNLMIGVNIFPIKAFNIAPNLRYSIP